jgi:hypothetical protein
MSTVTVVVWLVLPLVPLTVMVWFPIAAFLAALMVMVEVPAPVTEVGLKVMVSPLPWPDAERLIAELNPPVTDVVMVTEPEVLRATVSDVGEAEMPNPAVVEVTVSVTVVLCVVLPLVPLMVMG